VTVLARPLPRETQSVHHLLICPVMISRPVLSPPTAVLLWGGEVDPTTAMVSSPAARISPTAVLTTSQRLNVLWSSGDNSLYRNGILRLSITECSNHGRARACHPARTEPQAYR
jgi:hypothetical protein